MTGDAAEQRGKQQRRNHNLDEAQKNLAQNLQMRGHGGPEMSDDAAHNHAGQDPCSERATDGGISEQRGYRDP